MVRESMDVEEKAGSYLEVRGVGKTIGTTPVLGGVSFEVGRGECFCVLGENGSGKTTLLRIITGLVAPTEGMVLLEGISPHEDPVASLARMGALIGIPAFYPNISAYENLRLFWDGPLKAADTHIMNALSAVGLADEKKKKVGVFSRGMLQRLGIAHACMHQRPYIILDEPTQGVDEYWTAKMRDLFRDMINTGKAFIITSHDFEFVMNLCSHVLILAEGRPAYVGDLKAIAEYPYYFHLRCSPADKAETVFTQVDYIHKRIRSGDEFYLTLPDGRASELVKALVTAGCRVHECAKKHYSIADLIRQRSE